LEGWGERGESLYGGWGFAYMAGKELLACVRVP
jgi:hypothetical protein